MKPILAMTLALPFLTPITIHAATPPPEDVSALLAPIIKKHDVPGMAAAVVHNGEIVALGVTGVRTRGKPDKIAITDRFHISSDTKAMTAMLCGILVDEGKLKWDQTLGENFPELKKSMHRQYQAVTLEQLLTQRGGAPGELEKDELWGKLWQHKGTPTSARRLLLRGVTVKPPEATPGEKFIYSNAGVSIAGHMAEKVTNKSWEDLMREKIFRPLGMTTAGFGPPGTRAKNNQPAATNRRLPRRTRPRRRQSRRHRPGRHRPLLDRRLGQVHRRQPPVRQNQTGQTRNAREAPHTRPRRAKIRHVLDHR